MPPIRLNRYKVVKLGIDAGVTLYLAFYSRYYTPWLAVVWGIVVAIAILTEETDSWWEWEFKNRLSLAPSLQFGLILVLVAATALATNWSQWGLRDEIQWGWVLWTVPVFFVGGLQWAWRVVKTMVVRGK